MYVKINLESPESDFINYKSAIQQFSNSATQQKGPKNITSLTKFHNSALFHFDCIYPTEKFFFYFISLYILLFLSRQQNWTQVACARQLFLYSVILSRNFWRPYW